MAIIYSYPFKAAALADTVVITDSETVDPKKKTKKTSVSSIRDVILPVDNVTGTGTAGTYTAFTDSNTIGDGLIKNFTGSAGDITIPRFIRHEGDSSAVFGFNNEDDFIINVNAGVEQVRVRQNSISIQTDSGAKFLAGPTSASLYNDENGSTTVSKQSLTTYDSGIIVKGGTENSFARGGAVRFYTSTNNGYVGISGPTTTGTSYQIILPNSIGAVGQVLAIASIDGSNALMEWADNSGGGGGSFAGNAASGLPLASAGIPLASGATV